MCNIWKEDQTGQEMWGLFLLYVYVSSPQLHSIQDCGGVTDEIKCYLIKNEVKLHNDQPNQIERLEIKIQL